VHPLPLTAFASFLRTTKAALRNAAGLDRELAELRRHFDARVEALQINQGRVLAGINEGRHFAELRDCEFKVFSQWGEDGILQYLTSVVPIENRTFIEFGVEDFFESNCRFLMMKDNWQGYVIDGSEQNIRRLRDSGWFWCHDLQTVTAFITPENIDVLLIASGFDSDLGILSIDLDGIDYFVLDAIHVVRPRILVCEFNGLFGPVRPISVPLDPAFQRTAKHHSNLYWGASLAAMCLAAHRKGYGLVGTNSAGNNAFFVRSDLVREPLKVIEPAAAYRPPLFRESRSAKGALTYLRDAERLDAIRGLPVLNVLSGELEQL
jgi:hypothetical protein